MIAITSAVSNVTAILRGVVVFADPLGSSPGMVALRIAAFALVVVVAAMIPAPVRAAEAAGGDTADDGQEPARSGGTRTPAAARRSVLPGRPRWAGLSKPGDK